MKNRRPRDSSRANNKMMIMHMKKLKYIEQIITINIGLTDSLLDKLLSAKLLMEEIEEFGFNWISVKKDDSNIKQSSFYNPWPDNDDIPF